MRRWFIEALDLTRKTHRLELWAYVVMPEHAHVLFLPHSSNDRIKAILKTLKQSVSRRAVNYLRITAPDKLATIKVERGNGRTEYRFWQQGGGYDRIITHLGTAWKVVDYIHNNPVRRKLVAAPIDWPWSSARWYAGFEDAVLSMDAHPSHSGSHLDDELATGKQGLPMPPVRPSR
jgi:putative transposase